MQHTHFIDVNQLINIIPVVSNAILSASLGLWHRRHRRVLYSVLTVRQHCITVFGVTQTLRFGQDEISPVALSFGHI